MATRNTLVAIVILAICPMLAAAKRNPRANAGVPQVSFDYGLLDNLCVRLKDGQPVDEGAVQELRSRLGEFRELWGREGAPLLRETVRVTGHPFRFRETIAAMHLCPVMSNTSLPLTIAMRRYMRTAPAGEWAGSLFMFPVLVWHELLHRYVVDVLGSEPDTPLWAKYGAEPERVRWHLHLMAIEEAVLRRLGKDREFATVRAENARWPSYKRAREIVDKEGAEAFLAELRRPRARLGRDRR